MGIKKESPFGVSDDPRVIRLGFEPKTHSLEGCCSIQLSYRTNPLVSIDSQDAPLESFLQKPCKISDCGRIMQILWRIFLFCEKKKHQIRSEIPIL